MIKACKPLTLILAVLFLCTAAMSVSAETTLDTILSSGTTQAFKTDAVPEDDLNLILEAGLSASSAINQQPWYFAAITNQEVMNEIASGISMGGAPGADFADAPEAGDEADMPEEMPEMPVSSGAKAALGDSPVAIVIYMDESTSSPNASFDCGLAAQNMVIAANGLGYGTKIVSSTTMALNGEQHDAFCEKLGVDPSYQAVAVLLIGAVDTEVDGASGASTRSVIDEKVSFTE